MGDPGAAVVELASDELDEAQRGVLRAMLDAAYDGDFGDEDWVHALGGVHFVIREGPDVVSHASVVHRALVAAGRSFATGFVEAVATVEEHRGRGLGTAVMRAATEHIRAHYELGGLCTGEHAFYERLGWERWRGKTFVRTPDGHVVATPDEDGAVMVLRTGPSAGLDPTIELACEWRTGDVW